MVNPTVHILANTDIRSSINTANNSGIFEEWRRPSLCGLPVKLSVIFTLYLISDPKGLSHDIVGAKSRVGHSATVFSSIKFKWILYAEYVYLFNVLGRLV